MQQAVRRMPDGLAALIGKDQWEKAIVMFPARFFSLFQRGGPVEDFGSIWGYIMANKSAFASLVVMAK